MKPLLSLFFASFVAVSIGQTLDPSFQAPLPIRPAYICDILAEPDGKILLAGEIGYFRSQPVPRLIRLNDDGTLDESFSFDYEDDDVVMAVEKYGSDKYAVLLRTYDPVFFSGSEAKLVIINATGHVLAETFTANYAGEISVHSSGKILVSSSAGSLMYNADLTLDNNFTAKLAKAKAAKFWNDQVIIAGSFSEIDGTPKNDVARLNMDASIDDSFDAGEGTNNNIGTIMVQPDGKIVLGGTFINSFNGVAAGGTVRLNTDGSVDETFSPPNFNGPIGLPVYADEGIYLVAPIEMGGEETADWLIRLNPENGSIDDTFMPLSMETFASNDVQIAVSNTDVVTSRSQTSGNLFGVSMLDATGGYIDSFNPEVGRIGTLTFGDIYNDKIFVAGDFVQIDDVISFGAAQINWDGSVDPSFSLKENQGVIQQVEFLDNENILISTHQRFFKVDSQGNNRPEFSWAPFKNLWQVIKFKTLVDGKIMVGDANTIQRLNADGSEDTTFDMGELCCSVSTAFDFDLQGDKVIYGSMFESLGGISVNRLARLDEEGEVDESFNTGTGPDTDGNIYTVKVLDNNQIIVVGLFNAFDGHATTNGIVKLSPDGALDLSFNENLKSTELEFDIYPRQRIEQFDSMLYFHTESKVFAIKLDGSQDTDFDLPVTVTTLNDIIVAGDQSAAARSKSESGFMFALGNFKVGNSGETSAIVKIELSKEASPDPDPDPEPEPDVTTHSENGEYILDIQLFPQPVKETLKLQVPNSDGVHVATIFDHAGKKHYESNLVVVDRRADIDVSTFPSGMYILKLTNRKGQSSYIKYLKTK